MGDAERQMGNWEALKHGGVITKSGIFVSPRDYTPSLLGCPPRLLSAGVFSYFQPFGCVAFSSHWFAFKSPFPDAAFF